MYKVTMDKKYYYIKNDEELEKFKNKHSNKSLVVNWLKGLGEMSVDETEETLTSEEGRIIKKITIDDVKKSQDLFETLMGSSASLRKTYIKEHSKEATFSGI